MKIKPGQKVKVYQTPSSKVIEYGEVIGLGVDNKLILKRRPEFNTLRVNDFDLFREGRQVIFIGRCEQIPLLFCQPIKQSSI